MPNTACDGDRNDNRSERGDACSGGRYNEKVDLYVDGVLQERPITPFS